MKHLDKNWIKNARIFALEMWWPPFWPHIEIDWDKALWTMKRLELDTLQSNALCRWAAYPTHLVQRHPELGDRDLIMEAQQFCRKHGFKFIIYTMFGESMLVSTELSLPTPGIFRPMIPDRTIRQNDRHTLTVPEAYHDYFTIWLFGGERYLAHCVFAVEDWLLAITKEMADRYEYDATWVDGGVMTGFVNGKPLNVCTCPTCQQMYMADFGVPMPLITSLNDRRLMQLRTWVSIKMDQLLEKVVANFTKGQTVPIVGNLADTAEAWFFPATTKRYNGGLFEHAPDQVELVIKIGESRYLVDTAFHYPDCYDPWPRKVTSGWEVENKGLTILAHGGTPYLANPGKYYYDDSNDEPAQRIFSFMKKHKDLLETQVSDAFAGVVTGSFEIFSLPSSWGGEEKETASGSQPIHWHCVRGWTKALLDAHVPMSTLPWRKLEDPKIISEFPVIIFSDVELMTEATLEAVLHYIKEGGGALIEYDVASVTMELEKKRNPKLAELFDLREYAPSREELIRRYNCEGKEYGVLSGTTYEVYMRGNTDAMKACGFPIPGERIQPSHLGYTVPGDSWQILTELYATDTGETLLPGLAYRTFGKGKVLFSTVSWGIQYILRVDPVLAGWMSEVVKWLSRDSLRFQVDGSPLVQLGTMKVRDGYLLYLVNNSNDYQHRRSEWHEMMRVAARPMAVGNLSIKVEGFSNVDVLYGPDPLRIDTKGKGAIITYEDFTDHVVLHMF